MKQHLSNLTKVQSAIVAYYAIPWRKLVKKDRQRKYTYPRQMFHYLAHKELGIPTGVVGLFSERDHATVLHSCKKIDEWRSYDKDVINDLKVLSEKVANVSKITMLKRVFKEFWNNLIKVLKA